MAIATLHKPRPLRSLPPTLPTNRHGSQRAGGAENGSLPHLWCGRPASPYRYHPPIHYRKGPSGLPATDVPPMRGTCKYRPTTHPHSGLQRHPQLDCPPAPYIHLGGLLQLGSRDNSTNQRHHPRNHHNHRQCPVMVSTSPTSHGCVPYTHLQGKWHSNGHISTEG